MTSGLKLLKEWESKILPKTSYMRLIWPFINTRHRKRLSIMEKYLKDICISPLKQLHFNIIIQKRKYKKSVLTMTTESFNWLTKTILKKMKHITRFVSLLIKKWNRGHGIIVNLRNCIATPICQFARLHPKQTYLLSVYSTH
jgi:hypothetical protein